MVGDLKNIKLNNSVCEVVFIFGVIHHIPDWPKAFYEAACTLKPGGYLCRKIR
jgi:ubiquinone/menaquinone biosynthesis C-methylase UbiE